MNDIQLIAEMVTEHPDVTRDEDEVLLEWFFSRKIANYFDDPVEKQLAELIVPDDIKRIRSYYNVNYERALKAVMDDMMTELKSFKSKFSSLSDRDVLKAFIYYKKNKELPPELGARGEHAVEKSGARDIRGTPSHGAEQTARGHQQFSRAAYG